MTAAENATAPVADINPAAPADEIERVISAPADQPSEDVPPDEPASEPDTEAEDAEPENRHTLIPLGRGEGIMIRVMYDHFTGLCGDACWPVVALEVPEHEEGTFWCLEPEQAIRFGEALIRLGRQAIEGRYCPPEVDLG